MTWGGTHHALRAQTSWLSPLQCLAPGVTTTYLCLQRLVQWRPHCLAESVEAPAPVQCRGLGADSQQEPLAGLQVPGLESGQWL